MFSTEQGTIEEVRAALDQGKPVIAHGQFTPSGHIVLIIGYDEQGYFVHDPGGRWNEEYEGSYPNSGQCSGQAVHYQRGPFETALTIYNGNPEPLWYSTF